MTEEERIIAYVDDELDTAARAAFEAEMARAPRIAEAVAAHRALGARLSGRFDAVLEEPLPDRLRALFAAEPEGRVIDFAAAREKRAQRRRLPGWGSAGAAAASLAVGLFAGQMMVGGGAMVASRDDGALYARAGLERALDTQLASAQPADARIRIGVTFREGGGALCRTFDSTALAGIACRAGDRWRLRRTAAPEAAAAAQYRQAGSNELLAQAQAMMAGEPLDAAAERRARAAGWR